jgi:hypothetical protein
MTHKKKIIIVQKKSSTGMFSLSECSVTEHHRGSTKS